MSENVPPGTAAASDQPGKPYYDMLRTNLRATLDKKRKLDEQLAALEEQIYKVEGTYLEETANSGNIVRGFDAWVKNVTLNKTAADERRRGRIREDDRIFSRSSISWMRAQEGPESGNTSHAATPVASGPTLSAREMQAAAAGATKAGLKKKRLNDRDDDDDNIKAVKRSKITKAFVGLYDQRVRCIKAASFHTEVTGQGCSSHLQLRRIAEELDVSLCQLVGMEYHGADSTGRSNVLNDLTDGSLLQRAKHDPSLGQHGVIVIDEAHWHSNPLDLVLGLLKTITRPARTSDRPHVCDSECGCSHQLLPGSHSPTPVRQQVSSGYTMHDIEATIRAFVESWSPSKNNADLFGATAAANYPMLHHCLPQST